MCFILVFKIIKYGISIKNLRKIIFFNPFACISYNNIQLFVFNIHIYTYFSFD